MGVALAQGKGPQSQDDCQGCMTGHHDLADLVSYFCLWCSCLLSHNSHLTTPQTPKAQPCPRASAIAVPSACTSSYRWPTFFWS